MLPELTLIYDSVRINNVNIATRGNIPFYRYSFDNSRQIHRIHPSSTSV